MARLEGLIALPDGSTRKGRVTFSDRIETVETNSSAGDDFILPGLIDLQVNGSHGIDAMESSAERLLALAKALAREGTTSFLPTAITAPLEKIERVHAAVTEAVARGGGTESAAAILGMHLEGPFISPRRLGAHPGLNLEPRGEPLSRVMAMTTLRLITLAPELPGALEAIRLLASKDVAVSIGHTDATFEQARDAIGAGARMFTHTCNAMRPVHHRDPGVVAAAMTPSSARAAVIPDGVHVHPAMLRLIFNARGAAGMVLTSDKTAFSGIPSSPAAAGAGPSVVDRAVRLPDGTLAGSIISMLEGARLMVEQVDVGVGAAALMAATNPAALLGLSDRGQIAAGRRADLMLLDRALKLKAVFVAGREVV